MRIHIIFFIVLLSTLAYEGVSQSYKLKKHDIPLYRSDSTLKEVLTLDSQGNGFKLCFTKKGLLSARFEIINKEPSGKAEYFGENEKLLITHDPKIDTNKINFKRYGHKRSDYNLSYAFEYDSGSFAYNILLYPGGEIAALFEKPYSYVKQPKYAWYYDAEGNEIGRGSFLGRDRIDGIHVAYYNYQYNHDCSVCYIEPAKIQTIIEYDKNGTRLRATSFGPDQQLIGEGKFSYGKLYNGKYLDVCPYGISIILESYKLGRKHGLEVHYTQSMDTIRTITYFNGTKGFEKLGTPFKKLGIPLEGNYYKGEYYSGVFMDCSYIQEYKRGQPRGYVLKIRKDNFLPVYKSYIIDGLNEGSEERYDRDGFLIASGLYEKGIPVSGTFIRDYNDDIFIIEEFKKRKLIRKKIYLGDYSLQRNKNYQLIHECKFKEGKPYNGVDFDNNNNQYYTYVKGKKEGISFKLSQADTILLEYYYMDLLHGTKKEKSHDKPEEFLFSFWDNGKILDGYLSKGWYEREVWYYKESVLRSIKKYEDEYNIEYNIENNKKEGKCIVTILKHSNKQYEGEYKNDLPWSGDIMHEGELCQYIDGIKSKSCEYFSNYSVEYQNTNY